jgi:hypothetical protein
MPCCGQKTNSGFNNQSVQTRKSASAGSHPGYRYSVYFEYTGSTGLTVFGSGTNRKYRFDRPGRRIEVDPRDRPSLSRVPNLREVGSIGE